MKEIAPSIKVIIKNGNKILLIKTLDGRYDIPGGRVEYGENNGKTLNRELKEELGITINAGKLKLFDSWSYVSKSKNRHYVYVVYLYSGRINGKLKKIEVKDIIWMDINQIRALKHISYFKKMLLRAFK
jgi:ADP-ribose pyrophosphatase YjhB (NUDIX family)